MNNATETKATHLTVVPGLIERARERTGIRSEAAFARMLNVTPAEVERLRAGGEITVRGAVGIAAAFGMSLAEIVTDHTSKAVAA